MSTMYRGDTSLNFIIGMRLWPPESSLASEPCFWRSERASSRVSGEKYSKLRGIIEFHLPESSRKYLCNESLLELPVELKLWSFASLREKYLLPRETRKNSWR